MSAYPSQILSPKVYLQYPADSTINEVFLNALSNSYQRSFPHDLLSFSSNLPEKILERDHVSIRIYAQFQRGMAGPGICNLLYSTLPLVIGSDCLFLSKTFHVLSIQQSSLFAISARSLSLSLSSSESRRFLSRLFLLYLISHLQQKREESVGYRWVGWSFSFLCEIRYVTRVHESEERVTGGLFLCCRVVVRSLFSCRYFFLPLWEGGLGSL